MKMKLSKTKLKEQSVTLKFSQKFVPKKIGYYFIQCSWEEEPECLQLVYVSRDASNGSLQLTATPPLHGDNSSIPQGAWNNYWRWSKRILLK